MIRRIGVIYEDRNSLGFLIGLRDRLECEAEFVPPPAAIGRTAHLTRKTARRAWRHFQKKGVDLIVRFVDADRPRWQDVKRKEEEVFPDEAKALCVFGVAVNEVEDWLSLDRTYLAQRLSMDARELDDDKARSDRVKGGIANLARGGQSKSEAVAEIVSECPPETFRHWLETCDALQRFYEDCRQAAQRAGCETHNELDRGG